MSAPHVVVVMPVHNGEAFLRPAVDSILAQDHTSFTLLAVDDGSTDGSLDVLRSYDDPRLQVEVNPTNLNRSRTLNNAIEACDAEYVARMDADDIALPHRLSRQVALMQARPDIGVCGTWIRTFGGGPASTWRLPTDPDEVAARLLFTSVIAHPTVLMRRSVLQQHGLRYETDHLYAEDWDLWQRASRVTRLTNVPEVHLEYRIKSDAERALEPGIERRTTLRRAELRRIVARALDRIPMAYTEDDLELHLRLGSHDFRGEHELLDAFEQWLLRLQSANAASGAFAEPAFGRVLRDHWFHACYGNAQRGAWVVRRWAASPLAGRDGIALAKWPKLAVRVLARRGL